MNRRFYRSPPFYRRQIGGAGVLNMIGKHVTQAELKKVAEKVLQCFPPTAETGHIYCSDL